MRSDAPGPGVSGAPLRFAPATPGRSSAGYWLSGRDADGAVRFTHPQTCKVVISLCEMMLRLAERDGYNNRAGFSQSRLHRRRRLEIRLHCCQTLGLGGVTAELELWLDASDINGDGSSVGNGAVISNWQDKSGKDRDFDDFIGDPNYVLSGTHGQPTCAP